MSTPAISRRDALRFGAALGLGGVAPHGATAASDSVYSGLPLIALNEGRWEGTYRFVRPNGELVDRYDFVIDVSLSRDNARAYCQDSHYTWPDGRKQSLLFEAAYSDRQLTWDSGRIHGRLWEISDDTIYLTFGFNDAPHLRCHEMIQVSADGRQRGRTWLWYDGDELTQYTLIEECRADDGPPT